MATGTLFIISTPIGNLKDITFRAVETMKAAGYIIAEDTRTTQKLLNHYSIASKLISYHKFNEKERESEIITFLEGGSDVCLVSDAGTPLISDPGYTIVKACVENNIKVEAIPGPSSVLSSVILSGFDPGRFLFYGFLEKGDKNRREELEGIGSMVCPVVIFESPNRVKDTLGLITAIMPGRECAVVKELTKIHENVFRGLPENVAEGLTEENLKGEFVIVIGPMAHAKAEVDEGAIEKALLEKTAGGMTMKDAVKDVSQGLKAPKNTVYKISVRIKKEE